MRPEFNIANSGIKITSFNCYGFKSSVPNVCYLSLNSDTQLLQELWLGHHETHLLHTVHPDLTKQLNLATTKKYSNIEFKIGSPHIVYSSEAKLWKKSEFSKLEE